MAQEEITYLFRVLYSIAFTVNIAGNILVIVVVSRCKHLHNFTSFLLVNLAVSDLGLGVCGTVHLVISTTWATKDHILCSIMSTAVYLSAIVSVYTITLLAIERAVAIIWPFYSRRKATTKKLKIILPLVWIIAAIISSPSLVFFTGSDFKEERMACWDALTQDSFPPFYKIVLLVFMYLMPMIIIGASYGRIFRHLWTGENKKIRATNKTIFSSRRQLTKVLGFVIIAFNICWLPWITVDLLSTLNFIPKYVYLRSEIIAFCAVFNSSINPVVYSLQSKNFRRHVWGLFKKKNGFKPRRV